MIVKEMFMRNTQDRLRLWESIREGTFIRSSDSNGVLNAWTDLVDFCTIP